MDSFKGNNCETPLPNFLSPDRQFNLFERILYEYLHIYMDRFNYILINLEWKNYETSLLNSYPQIGI